MGNVFKIRFSNGNYARAVHVTPHEAPETVRIRLRLHFYRNALLVHAGAGGATAELVTELEPIFRDDLAPLASRHRIAVLDGGTEKGLVGLMGDARRDTKGTYPLIGVAPGDAVLYPGSPTDGIRFPLDPNHTHFVLIKSDEWGIESSMLVGLGKTIAQHQVALVVNGGEIVRREALMHARQGTPLLVLAGSGRVADEVVDGLKRGTSNQILLETLKIGKIQVCTPETMIVKLRSMLNLEN